MIHTPLQGKSLNPLLWSGCVFLASSFPQDFTANSEENILIGLFRVIIIIFLSVNFPKIKRTKFLKRLLFHCVPVAAAVAGSPGQGGQQDAD